MSRTNHHRNQKRQHYGHDYGSRYKCNKSYSTGYGGDGRTKANIERRNESKKIISEQLDS